MAQNVFKEDYDLTKKGEDTVSLVESIRKYILENDCPSLEMDISNLNLIDASKVTILCSTYHWAKYPNGEISWKTSYPEVQNIVKPLNLGNIRLITD